MTTSNLLGVASDESEDGLSREHSLGSDGQLLFSDTESVPRSNEGTTTPKKTAFGEDEEWDVVPCSQPDDAAHTVSTGCGSPPGMTTSSTHAIVARAKSPEAVWKPKSDGTGLQKPQRLDIVLVDGGALNSNECLEDMRQDQDEKERKQQEQQGRAQQREARREETKREDEEKRKRQEDRKRAAEEKKEEKRRRAEEREEVKRQREPQQRGRKGEEKRGGWGCQRESLDNIGDGAEACGRTSNA